MIPYGRQHITQVDIDEVIAVLRAEFVTQGPAVPRFEDAVAARVGAKHAVALNSGTSALHVACLAMELGPDDLLWTSPITFVASANCARYCGASVDFVDIDPHTWNLSVPKLKEKLARARKGARLPKVVVPVHFGGQPTEQEAIWELSQEYGFHVLEDAAHSIGATRNGEPVGSCRWSHVTALSFHPVKIITTGEGGMALTNSAELAERMALFRSHGVTRDAARFRDGRELASSGGGPPAWYYEQLDLGYNYRMTDIQAALGVSQLQRLTRYLERRNALARRYDEALERLPVHRPVVQAGNLSAFHLYAIRLRTERIARTHRQVFDGMRERGIGVNLHYRPVHLQPYYRALGFAPGQFPEAEAYASAALTLPLFPEMTGVEQERVVDALEKVLS